MSPCPLPFCKTEHGGYGSCTARQKMNSFFLSLNRLASERNWKDRNFDFVWDDHVQQCLFRMFDGGQRGVASLTLRLSRNTAAFEVTN